MAGFDNEVVYSIGERLQPSTTQAIILMQKTASDVSNINHTGNPEGVVSANPSSLSHDPVTGNFYLKQTGTGNTGWSQILTSPPPPNQTVILVDDFVSNNNNNSIGSLSWNTPGISGNSAEINHPGIMSIPNFPGSPAYCILAPPSGSPQGSFVLGGGLFSLNFVNRLDSLSTVTDTFVIALGLQDVISALATTIPPVNGVYFKYTHTINSGNWQIITTSASISTIVNTSVPADTSFHNFGIIINSAATNVSFTIDGVSVGTITTNIPTAIISPAISYFSSLGAPLGFSIDLFYATLNLTTSR